MKAGNDMTDLDNQKYIVCCLMCDNEKCVKGTDKCEAEQWKKKKIGEGEKWDEKEND